MSVLTIRSRAIELSRDGQHFDLSGSLPQHFEDPGDAKLEADAHLAVAADHITQELATSELHKQRFLSEYNSDKRSIEPGARSTLWHFRPLFNRVYADSELISNFFTSTDIGHKTIQACSGYVEANHSLPQDRRSRMANAHLYAKPAELVRSGIATFSTQMRVILWGVNFAKGMAEVDAEGRQHLLEASSLDLLRLGSLSLNQIAGYRTAHPVIEGGRISLIDDIERIRREKPLYSENYLETIRPHRGCPAMPNLPANDRLYGGSGISKLYERASQLIVATGMHALTVPQD